MYKYELICENLKAEIENNKIKPGESLPSIRNLSKKYNTSVGTIIKSLSILENQHLVYSKPQSGYYVIEKGFTKNNSENEMIQASTSYPDINLFPYDDFQHCMIQAINTNKENLFSYTNPQGLPSLLQTIQKHLEDYQIFTKLDNLFITTGSQQAIDLLTKMPFPNKGDTILVEQPTYYGALKAFELNNIPTVGIKRDFSGINLNELEEKFKKYNFKFFYTTPRLHNPLGYSYTIKEMKSILYLAEKYKVYILEDDCMADFISSSKLLPMYAYDKNDFVINAKSFSKILLPGLRLSSLVLPEILIDTFSEYKKWADVNSTIISQGALEIFIKSGMYAIHKEKMKLLYSDRISYLIKKIENNMKDNLTFSKPSGGYFLCIKTPNGSNYSKVMKILDAQNIKMVDIRVCFLKNNRNSSYYRLSVSKMNKKSIDIAIPKIMDVISKNSF